MSGFFYSAPNSGPFFQFSSDLPAPPHSEGLLWYDRENKTLAQFVSENQVTQQLGQELYDRVSNKSGDILLDGKVIYVTGAQGSRHTIDYGKSNLPGTSGGVIALTTHDIANNQNGVVTTFGIVHGLNTAAWPAGTPLWLSDSDEGGLVSTIPSPPSFPIRIGEVLRQHEDEGEIFVNIGPTDVTGDMVIQHLALNTALNLKEITTPVAIPGYGAVYFKNDNKMYAQDGAGNEHVVAYAP